MSRCLVGRSVMVVAGCFGAHQVQVPGAPPDAGPSADAATVAVRDEVACVLEPGLACCVSR